MVLRRSPCAEAVPRLAELLETPELTGTVELSFRQIIDACSPDPCDNLQRNCQLKELYLLKALQACDPDHPLARARLKAYADSPVWLYASFARR